MLKFDKPISRPAIGGCHFRMIRKEGSRLDIVFEEADPLENPLGSTCVLQVTDADAARLLEQIEKLTYPLLKAELAKAGKG